MVQRKATNNNLVRAVLLGLVAGVATMPFADTASAQTLKEYKAQLAEQYPGYKAMLEKEANQVAPCTGGTAPDVNPSGNSVVAETDEWKHVVLDENSSYDRLQANGEGWLTVTAKDGTKVQPTKIVSATGSCVHGQEGGYVHVAVGDVNWDDPASIKSTPEKVADMTDVKFEVYDGDIVFANGTVKAKAENFFAGSEGYISIGEMDDTDSFEGLFNASAVLKLEIGRAHV